MNKQMALGIKVRAVIEKNSINKITKNKTQDTRNNNKTFTEQKQQSNENIEDWILRV